LDETPLSLWFVEDRLKTLQLVHQQPDLDAVKLYLADWGYNTPLSGNLPRMTANSAVVTLPFAENFSAWP